MLLHILDKEEGSPSHWESHSLKNKNKTIAAPLVNMRRTMTEGWQRKKLKQQTLTDDEKGTERKSAAGGCVINLSSTTPAGDVTIQQHAHCQLHLLYSVNHLSKISNCIVRCPERQFQQQMYIWNACPQTTKRCIGEWSVSGTVHRMTPILSH